MKRCTLVIPDAEPFNSLWVADELGLLPALDMPILVIDAVHDERTGDPRYRKDREVRDFIADHQPPLVRVDTEFRQFAWARRARSEKPKRNVLRIDAY